MYQPHFPRNNINKKGYNQEDDIVHQAMLQAQTQNRISELMREKRESQTSLRTS